MVGAFAEKVEQWGRIVPLRAVLLVSVPPSSGGDSASAELMCDTSGLDKLVPDP